MRYTGAIFDLDGTLLDTVPGLAKAMNEVLIAHNFPTHTAEEYKIFIGNGVKALVEQSVPKHTDPKLIERMYQEKSKLYDVYWKEGTNLFPGIASLLSDLSEKKILMGICSNKENYFTQQIVAHFLNDWSFIYVTGRTQEIPKKPDPTGLLTIMSQAPTVTPHQWVYIGDKDADIQSAKNAHIASIWVSWGYQKTPPQDTQIVHAPHELNDFF